MALTLAWLVWEVAPGQPSLLVAFSMEQIMIILQGNATLVPFSSPISYTLFVFLTYVELLIIHILSAKETDSLGSWGEWVKELLLAKKI